MKKLLLLFLTVLTASLAAQADVAINATNFPDANFRSYLLSEYSVGYITTAQLQARTTLEVNSKGISNMKGVEYFTELTRLSCYGNNLTSIDVSSNTKLTYLNVYDNKLIAINGLANCAVLEQLYLHYNQLTSLSIYNHSALRTLWMHNNPNLTTLTCYRNALTNFTVNGCTALESLKCYENASLSTIQGLADCTALTYLDCEDCAISDLSALSGMSGLQTLLARNNLLTTLDVSYKSDLVRLRVSGNTRLTDLKCYNCDLNSLDVTNCTALSSLKCYFNYSLDGISGLSSCTALTYLDCEDCAITSLPGVNNLTNLETLWCRNNQITTLEVTQKSNLHYLRVSGNTGLTKLNCRKNALTNLDVTNCTALEDLDCCENASLTTITGLATCTALTYFSAEYCALSSSLDMTFCPGLLTLYCYHNNLTALNVTGLSKLQILNCMQNEDLTEITGITDCLQLTYVECSDCSLTSLILDNANHLQELRCMNNYLTSLSIMSKHDLTKLYASGNSLLEVLMCNDCALTELEINDCPQLYYLDCTSNQLTSLSTTSNPRLNYFLCGNNQISDLNLRYNSELLYLWCYYNELTSLDLSRIFGDFLSLDCRYNHIAGTIDVSRFTDLRQLAISDNEISQVFLDNHSSLTDIWAENNQLTSIDVSGCSALQSLRLTNNQLSTLDVSGLSNLNELYVHYNQLTSLNVNDCPSLRTVANYNNILTAGPMGQFVDGLPTLSEDDPGRLYAIVEYPAESEHVERNVITASQVSQAAAKYWNVYCWNWDTNSWESYAGSAFTRGDVNDDGSVNISDVTTLIDYLLSGNADGVNLSAADCSQDGSVNISDVTVLIDYLLSNNWPAKLRTAPTATELAEPMLPIHELQLQRPTPRR